MKIKISRITIAIGVFIIISASFARQLMNFIKANIGEGGFVVLVKLILIISVLTFLLFILRSRNSSIKILLFIVMLTLSLVLSWQIEIPEEKIHILEYAVLGWFVGKDLIKEHKKIKGAISACLFGITVGILDEIFQAILPYRFYQTRDIVFNSLGSLGGVVFYLLS